MKPLRLLSVVLGLGLTAGSVASGELIAHESFDYPGTTAGGQGGAANGWAGAWSLTQNGPDNFHRITTGSLAYPAGVDLTPAGGRISNMSDEVLKRDLAAPISTSPSTPGEIWVSMLLQKSDTGSIDFGFERASDGVRRLVWGFGADEKFRVNVADATPFFASSETFAVDQPLLVVVRLSLSNANTNTADSISLKVFQAGDTISAPVQTTDFDVHQSNGTSIVANRFVIDGNGQVTQVDEIRIGRSFADVVPVVVPEPSAMAILGGASALLLRRP